jgi:hypothetical protein
MAVQLPKPAAVCPKCGIASYNAILIKQRCAQRINGTPCTGVIESALGEHDWAACKACSGEGCTECYDVGWLFVSRWRYAH